MDEISARAAHGTANRTDVIALSRTLPRGPALEAALRASVAESNVRAFVPAMLAAAHARRVLPEDVIVEGASLLCQPDDVLSCRWCLAPERVQDVFLEVARRAFVLPVVRIAALLASVWAARGAGVAAHPDVVPLARRLVAIAPVVDIEASDLLLALGAQIPEAALVELVRLEESPEGGALLEALGDVFGRDPLATLPLYRSARASEGPKVPRNASCPCGSGKKYKVCCGAPNQPTLPDGPAPLPDDPRDLVRMAPADLVRIDPTPLGLEYRIVLAESLVSVGRLDLALRALAGTDGLPAAEMGILATRILFAEGPAGIGALAEVVPEAAWGPEIRIGLAALRGPEVLFAEIEAQTRASLDDPTPVARVLPLVAPAIGSVFQLAVYFCSGAYLPEADVAMVSLRGSLDLEPFPPILRPADEAPQAEAPTPDLARDTAEDLEDQLAAERARTAAEAAARARAEAALRALRARLHDPPAARPAAAPDPEEVRSLRARVAELRREVVDLHDDRNALRRALEQQRVVAPTVAPPSDPVPEEAEEDDVVDSVPELAVQPARLPRLRDAFADAVRGVPDAVARTTLELVGALAAGSATAFAGARPLKGLPDTWRQRVGRSYRLLFRFDGAHLDVVDLVHRQELENRLRRLK